jgi:hypothetical protein
VKGADPHEVFALLACLALILAMCMQDSDGADVRRREHTRKITNCVRTCLPSAPMTTSIPSILMLACGVDLWRFVLDDHMCN